MRKAWFLAAAWMCAGWVVAQDRAVPGNWAAALASDGQTRVLVTLAAAEGAGPAGLNRLQDDVLQRLSQHQTLDRADVRRLMRYPAMALTVDAAGLKALQQDPAVRRVQPDRLRYASLRDSTYIIGAFQAQGYGLQGLGQAVAVLDTGVDLAHPFLAGATVAEACFSTTTTSNLPGFVWSATSLCPAGVPSATQAGSAQDCADVPGCGHGTHVAGIAVGGSVASGAGVAPAASLIAVKVFSRLDGPDACPFLPAGSACLAAFDSDVLAGLEHVWTLSSTIPVAAVNLSLGSDRHTDFCDDVPDLAPYKTVIDALRAAGIATVIASGNNGWADAVSAPGCISSAITVGSTTKADTLSDFSNNAPMVDLLAPGSAIESAAVGGGFVVADGTSMAAPHVAGAWAIVKASRPQSSVDELERAFETSGLPVADPLVPGLVHPRIQLIDAIALLRREDGLRGRDQDFDGDGRADIFVRQSGTGHTWLYRMDGPAVQGSSFAYALDPQWLIIAVADFNGMGRMDTLLRNTVSGELWIVFMDGPRPTYGGSAGPLPAQWAVAGVGDFDGDGKADILLRQPFTGQLWLYLMNGTTRKASVNAGGLAIDWRVERVADFNGDGRADILIRHRTTGQLWMFLMDGGTRLASLNALALPADWQVVGAADLDGDGKADILARQYPSGRLWLFRMDGATRIGSQPAGGLALPWEIVKLADFDDDGRADMLLRRPDTGQMWMFLMDGATRRASSNLPGAPVPPGWGVQ